MNLQSPASLLWLLPIAGAIIALYLMRMRRRRLVVPALFLWPERQDEVRANALFQRLRFSWLLLLQLLAALAAVLVLARPQMLQRGLAGKVTAVVVDASSSMGASDVVPDRFGAASKTVADMIESAGPGDRIALIEAGPSPRVVFPLSSDSVAQRRGLQQLTRYDSEADVGEALRLASSLVGTTEGGTILLLSDGAFEPIQDFVPGKAKVVFKQVGSKSENVAVQALGSTEGPQGRLLYCGLKNFGSDVTQARVTIIADGKAIDSADATLESKGTWGKTLKVPRDSRVFEARLDRGGGFLQADDVAYHVNEPGATLRVLLVGPGDFFTERALVLDPRVTLDRSSSLPASEVPGSGGPSSYDVVVFSGAPEQPCKARGVLTLGRAGDVTPVKVGGKYSKPGSFVPVTDPLLNGVRFDGVYVDSGEKVRPSGSGRTILDSDKGPIIVASSGARRQVYTSFAPLESDFPLSVGFPIFIANALDFLAPRALGSNLAVTPARPQVLPWPKDGAVQVSGPAGFRADALSRDGRVTVKGLDRVGVYTVGSGKGQKRLLAGLRSDSESNIEPRSTVQLGGEQVARLASPVRFADFWRPILLLLLVILAVEWWLYGRLS